VNAEKPNINALTLMFFLLNFLAATQDIIVDGWAISMLKRFVVFTRNIRKIINFKFIFILENSCKIII